MHTEDPKASNLPSQSVPPPLDKFVLSRQHESVQSHLKTGIESSGGARKLRIVTLGVYGFDETRFFAALHAAGADTFCDLRARRGVRGREYAFVNSKRLQTRLAELDIRYFHLKELAPSKALRERQAAADKAERTAKRQRTELSELFITDYREECLQTFNSRKLIEQVGHGARVVALFCVERAAAACHRSLVAERLKQDLGLEVVHLLPS